MFGLFKTDPIKKLREKSTHLYQEAMHIQRSGDLRLYAKKMEQIEQIEQQIGVLKQS